MPITSYFLETYPGGKRTMLMGLDVTDGKAKGVLVSMHRSRAVAAAKRDKLNAAIAATEK